MNEVIVLGAACIAIDAHQGAFKGLSALEPGACALREAVSRGRRGVVVCLMAACGWLAGSIAGSPAMAQESTQESETEQIEAGSESSESSAEAPEQAAQEEPAEPDRRNVFELELEDGGSVAGKAMVVELTDDGRALLSGNVEILHQDIKITADGVELDPETQHIVAYGQVVFDQGPQRLVGTRLEFNLDEKVGSIDEVSGFVSNDYYFEASRVSKTGEDTFVMEEGRFSSCEGEVPSWSFGAKKVNFTVDKFAKAKGVTFRVKKVPLIYLPYFRYPVRSERTSGLLMPKPGYSSRRGPTLGLAYFQTLGRSADTTFFVDLFGGGTPQGGLGSGNYLGLGNEIRYRLSEGTRGELRAYFIKDPEVDDTRWKIELNHESRGLPGGFRGVIKIDEVSDFDFFRDFERRGDRNSRRQLYSYGFLTKNWGQQSLNLQFDSRETFLSSGNTISLRQLPEVEYKLRSTRLGRTPLYLQLRSSVHFLDSDRSEQLNSSYARGDVFPQITMPIRSRPWLSFSFTGGGRFTWWGDSLLTAQERAESQGDSHFRGEGLTRFVPTAGAEIVGPSFSRIFDGGGKRWSKLKHVIEPRFTYSFFDDFEDRVRIPVFDEVDNVRGRNIGRISLINRLLAKAPSDQGGGAVQLLSFEVYQDISFDPDIPLQFSVKEPLVKKSQGPLTTLFRFNPSRRTSLRTEVAYNTLFSEIENTSVSGSFSFLRNNLIGLRWARRLNAESGITRSDQLRLSTRIQLVPNRLTFASQVNYDIERSLLQLQRHLLSFRGSCYSLSLEAGDYRQGARRDREFRFLVTLKNVGTFLDLTGGDSETL